WPDALAQIDAALLDPSERLARSRALDARVHAYRDGRNAERVYRAIVEAVGTTTGRDRPQEDTP
ncbi:MAG: hypothetical protein K0R60_721, partial [Microbacterium sp.]|nr:hypothetical protein [Microbacterium sp.]